MWIVAFYGIVVFLIKQRVELWLIAGMGFCLVTMEPHFIRIKRSGLVDKFLCEMQFVSSQSANARWL
jgi:hypothetical protein